MRFCCRFAALICAFLIGARLFECIVFADDARILKGHRSLVTHVAFSPDSRLLASSSCDETVKLWNVATGEIVTTLEGHHEFVWRVAFSPDGRRLASAGKDGTIRIWDVKDGGPVRKLSVEAGEVKGVAFSPDGKLLLSVSTYLQLWNTETWTPFEPPLGVAKWSSIAAFDARGHRLCCPSLFGSPFWKWDQEADTFVQEETQLLRQGLRHRSMGRFALRPDGMCLALIGQEWTIEIWNIDKSTMECALEGHTDAIVSMAFSSDGKRLVSAGKDKLVKVWDIDNAREELKLTGHTEEIWAVAFSPNGRHVASCGEGSTVCLWPVPAAHTTPD